MEERREAAVLVGVVVRRHFAAAAPVLVANADERHLPRLVAAVGAALLRQGVVTRRGHVLDPLAHLGRVGRADIHRDIWIGADLFGEVHELVGAEGVGLGRAAPPVVLARGTLVARTDAVAPVVLVSKAAARPADYGRLDRLQRADDVAAHAPDIGDLGVRADPDAVIDAGAQMFGKLTVDVARDRGAGLVSPQRRRGGDFARLRARRHGQQSDRRA